MNTLQQSLKVLGFGFATLAVASCSAPLDVRWENDPDRRVALAEASNVESLIGSLYRLTVNTHHTNSGAKYGAHLRTLFMSVGDEIITTGNVDGGQWDSSRGWPRVGFNNDPSAVNLTDPTGARRYWYAMHEVVSNANDALWKINEGMRLTQVTAGGTVDNTQRGQAMAKLNQGIAWGYLAITFDRAILIDETLLPLPDANPAQLSQIVGANLKPYPEVRDRALRAIEEAIQMAQANPAMVFPGAWWGSAGTADVNSQLFIRIARSYAARIITYTARRPAERQAADWARVLGYTADPIASDFGPVIGSGLASSILFGTLQSDAGFRLHHGIVGPADVSGAYQRWFSTPYASRFPFAIVTPDRRVTGPTPETRGSYVRYRNPSDFGGLLQGAAFTPHHGYYQWFRLSGASTTGQATMIRADEIRLIRAEAFARTGRAEEAAALVNVSRTRPQTIGAVTYSGLPPVTAAGVPQAGDCVPRTEAGNCGSLLDAIRYERMLESVGTSVIRGYADNRGWGRLTPGTWLHYPVPGQELLIVGESVYSWGGSADTQWSAQ